MHCYLNRVKNLGYPLPSYGETVPDTFSPDPFLFLPWALPNLSPIRAGLRFAARTISPPQSAP